MSYKFGNLKCNFHSSVQQAVNVMQLVCQIFKSLLYCYAEKLFFWPAAVCLNLKETDPFQLVFNHSIINENASIDLESEDQKTVDLECMIDRAWEWLGLVIAAIFNYKMEISVHIKSQKVCQFNDISLWNKNSLVC